MMNNRFHCFQPCTPLGVPSFQVISRSMLLLLIVLAVIATLWAPLAESATFATGRPKRLNRTDIGVEGQQVWVRFSSFNVERLRQVFFDGRYRKVLPNATRDKLQVHRREMIGQTYYLNAKEPLPLAVLRQSVLIPPSAYGFLGVAGLPHIQLRILGRDIVMVDTRTRKVHDILSGFLR